MRSKSEEGWVMRFAGFRAAGFRVQGSGFRVQGSGFRVQGSEFRVQGLREPESFVALTPNLSRNPEL